MKTIRIGVIGVSGRGTMADLWNNPEQGTCLAGGADISKKHLDAFRKRNGKNLFVTTDYRKLIARKDVDAVAVFSPDFCHEEHAVAVLQAGKHLFCEKPLAITVDGCDRILRAWQRAGTRFLMGFNMRYMNMVRTMKQIVDEGLIGEVKAAWVRHFVPSGGDWYFHDWHAKKANTTSLLLQKASHDIDVVHWICGGYGVKVVGMGGRYWYGGDKPNDLVCDACPDRDTCPDVQPRGHSRQQCAFRREVDNEDVNHILWTLDNGVQCSYVQCHFPPRMDKSRNYCFIGTQGAIENVWRDGADHIMLWTRKSKSWTAYANRDYAVKTPEGTHSGADPIIVREFADLLRRNIPTTAKPLDGRMSVAVGCAGAESVRRGSIPIAVKPLPADLKGLAAGKAIGNW
jgi:predicted dehydrogenase